MKRIILAFVFLLFAVSLFAATATPTLTATLTPTKTATATYTYTRTYTVTPTPTMAYVCVYAPIITNIMGGKSPTINNAPSVFSSGKGQTMLYSNTDTAYCIIIFRGVSSVLFSDSRCKTLSILEQGNTWTAYNYPDLQDNIYLIQHPNVYQ
jgi:hypothetical protein